MVCFGALAAANLVPATETCQEACGPNARVWVQVDNAGAYITADPGAKIAVYGELDGVLTLLGEGSIAAALVPGGRSAAVPVDIDDWSDWDGLWASVDDPALVAGAPWGATKECDEDDNLMPIDTSALCL